MSRRIVSFLPSSTEILYELGLEAQITGVTHECKYPESAREKPMVVNAAFDTSNMSSSEIDRKISEISRTDGQVYVINEQLLREASPDLIIAQGVCRVCAPHTREIESAANILGYKPRVITLDPHDFDDVMSSILNIAKHVGRENQGRALVSGLHQRINRVKTRILDAPKVVADFRRPRVLCLEWIHPFYIAGHWIPQMVEIAGGSNCLGSSGEASHRISVDEVSRCRPDKIIVMPCGFDLNRTKEEMDILHSDHNWEQLCIIGDEEVYAVNANSYFSKPGPRLVVGLEILAKLLNPSLFDDLELPSDSYKRITGRSI